MLEAIKIWFAHRRAIRAHNAECRALAKQLGVPAEVVRKSMDVRCIHGKSIGSPCPDCDFNTDLEPGQMPRGPRI
jgi:hypothetical protein